MYYVITCIPDGITVEEKTREALCQAITPDASGHVELDASLALDDLPDSDPNYWGGGLLIIKGEVITLKKEEVVTIRYEIE